MGELPVENGPDAVGADDEVAVAEIPCTTTGDEGSGRLCPSQRKADSKAGCG